MAIILGLLFAAATIVLTLTPWTWRVSPEWVAREVERWYPERGVGEAFTGEPETLVRDAEEDLRTGKPRDAAVSAEGAGR